MLEEKKFPIIQFKRAVNLKRIERLIDRSLERLRPHYETEPTGAEFDTFVRDFWEIFPQTIRYDVFYASLMTLAGRTLTRELIKATAWRLAGNLARLNKGQPVPPWTRQPELEWVAIKIVRCRPGWSKYDKLGFWYDYRVLSGLSAGLRFELFWSLRFIRMIAKEIGFSRFNNGPFKLHNGTELVGMHMYLLFDPQLSTDEKPVNYHYLVPAACKARNRKILQQRVRIIPCPQKFSLSQMACHQCPYGYDQCPASCHPFTYQPKFCPRCNNEGWFDQIGRGTICVDCEDQEAMSRQEKL